MKIFLVSTNILLLRAEKAKLCGGYGKRIQVLKFELYIYITYLLKCNYCRIQWFLMMHQNIFTLQKDSRKTFLLSLR